MYILLFALLMNPHRQLEMDKPALYKVVFTLEDMPHKTIFVRSVKEPMKINNNICYFPKDAVPGNTIEAIPIVIKRSQDYDVFLVIGNQQYLLNTITLITKGP